MPGRDFSEVFTLERRGFSEGRDKMLSFTLEGRSLSDEFLFPFPSNEHFQEELLFA